jgi:hypothetical protein
VCTITHSFDGGCVGRNCIAAGAGLRPYCGWAGVCVCASFIPACVQAWVDAAGNPSRGPGPHRLVTADNFATHTGDQ